MVAPPAVLAYRRDRQPAPCVGAPPYASAETMATSQCTAVHGAYEVVVTVAAGRKGVRDESEDFTWTGAPSWVPASGHALRHAGVHFDAVRIAGFLAEQVAYELMQFTDFQAGPIVRESTGGGDGICTSCFRLRPRPLDWRSRPTFEVPFVEPELLYDAVICAVR